MSEVMRVALSNKELSVAIEDAFYLIHKCPPSSGKYLPLIEHFKALLLVQQKRAAMHYLGEGNE